MATEAAVKQLEAESLKIGGRYNFKLQPERLMYVGNFGPWHQFTKIGDSASVWVELLGPEICLLEETADSIDGPVDIVEELVDNIEKFLDSLDEFDSIEGDSK